MTVGEIEVAFACGARVTVFCVETAETGEEALGWVEVVGCHHSCSMDDLG